MELKRFVLYLIEWLMPSCTVFYIILSSAVTWGTYSFWGYAINIPSYILASLVGAALFYYLNLYIFQGKNHSVRIKINGQWLTVSNHDSFIVYDNKEYQKQFSHYKFPKYIRRDND